MNEHKRMMAERDKGLIELDVEWARKTMLPFVPSHPLVYLIALHKVRYACTEIPRELRHESAAWLRARGYRDHNNMPLLPEGELPE